MPSSAGHWSDQTQGGASQHPSGSCSASGVPARVYSAPSACNHPHPDPSPLQDLNRHIFFSSKLDRLHYRILTALSSTALSPICLHCRILRAWPCPQILDRHMVSHHHTLPCQECRPCPHQLHRLPLPLHLLPCPKFPGLLCTELVHFISLNPVGLFAHYSIRMLSTLPTLLWHHLNE